MPCCPSFRFNLFAWRGVAFPFLPIVLQIFITVVCGPSMHTLTKYPPWHFAEYAPVAMQGSALAGDVILPYQIVIFPTQAQQKLNAMALCR